MIPADVALLAAVAVPAAAFLALACCRRPASVRTAGLAQFSVCAIGLRLILALQGQALSPDAWLALAESVLFAAVLTGFRDAWLVRDSANNLRARIDEGARRLRLHADEPITGTIHITSRAAAWEIRITALSLRLQKVTLPRPRDQDKAALLVDWLSKQYPAPCPRIRISLTRRNP
jgi:hypothetical protein